MDQCTIASCHAADDPVGRDDVVVRRLSDIHELAATQEGLVRRQQLKRLGVSRAVVASMVGRGLLCQLTPQVFLVGVTEPTWRQQATAAVWQAGAGAVLSHGAAARWWGLPGYEHAPVTVTVGPRRARPRNTIGTVVRSKRMAEDEVVNVGPLRVVTGAYRTQSFDGPRNRALLGPRSRGPLHDCVLTDLTPAATIVP